MNPGPDMFSAGLQMIASLAVVIIVIVLLLQWFKRLGLQRTGLAGEKRIQVLENHYLGVKKSVCLVRVPGKVLVLGVSNDRITLLDKVDESQVETLPQSPPPKAFGRMVADRLKRFGDNGKRGDDR